MIERAIWAQGLRKKLDPEKKRHPFTAVHSFRKWFKTRCEMAGMKPINIELLLSHSVGISNSYYRPTENDILKDYLKICDFLSIDKENKLQQEFNKLREDKNKENYTIIAKLQDKEDKINKLLERDQITEVIANLSDRLMILTQKLLSLENRI